MLKRVTYAGYIEHDPWGITRRKGHHTPIISLETFERIQERKRSKPIAPRRVDINKDFPLRGVVACGCCDKPMTSCWSKSATGKRYPYFWCQNSGCDGYRKNIRAEKIDTGFEAVLRSLTPSKQMLSIAIAMLQDAQGQRADQSVHAASSLRCQLTALQKQQDTLLDRITETTNSKVLTAFETKIASLEDEKLRLSHHLEQGATPREITPKVFELLERFLSSPWKIYENGSLATKKTIQQMAFTAPLAFDRKTGFRTPQTSVIFRFLDDVGDKCKMVPPHGLEPRTY
jgi:hypothetical protein